MERIGDFLGAKYKSITIICHRNGPYDVAL